VQEKSPPSSETVSNHGRCSEPRVWLVKGSQRCGYDRRRRQRPAVVQQALFDVALMLDGAVGFAEERGVGFFAIGDEDQDTCVGVRPADHHPLVAAGKRPVPPHAGDYRAIARRSYDGGVNSAQKTNGRASRPAVGVRAALTAVRS
jgi:hypothetical protein